MTEQPVNTLAPSSTPAPATPPPAGICLDDHFGVDAGKAEGGVWVHVGDKFPKLKGFHLKIARANTPKARAALLELMQEGGREVGGRRGALSVSPEALEDMTTRILASHVLLDWRGNRDRNGNEIPFSVEAAESALRRFPDFRDLVSEYAGDFDLFRAQVMEDAGKN